MLEDCKSTQDQHHCSSKLPMPAWPSPTPYLMSSNSPSGGMKLMLLSESNLLSLTHWWKVQSSMAIDCLPLKHKTELNSCKLQPLYLGTVEVCSGRNYSTERVAIAGVQEMGRQGEI